MTEAALKQDTQQESHAHQELIDLLGSVDISLNDLRKFDDETIEGIYSFAYSYYENGWYDEAENLFRLLVSLRIRKYSYWKGLGATLQMLKKYEEAIEAYSWAAITDQSISDPYPHFHAAECFHTMGDYTRGLKALYSAKTIAKKQGTYHALLQQIDLLQQTWRNKRS
ncbi:MAG: SycD/LcrH family type III secretion system chaperone [Chlamydiota bacterium]